MHTHPAHSYVVGGWMAWTLSMLGCGLGTEHAWVWIGHWARSGVDWALSTLGCGWGTEHARVWMGHWARSGVDWVLSTLWCGLKWLVRIEPLEAAAQREEQSSCVSGQVRGAQRGAGGCGQGGQGLCLRRRYEWGDRACWLVQEALGRWAARFNLHTAGRRRYFACYFKLGRKMRSSLVLLYPI